MGRGIAVWGVWLAGCAVPTAIGELEPEDDATSSTAASSTSTSTTVEVETATTSGGNTSTSTSDGTGSEDSTGEAIAPRMTSFSIRRGDIPEDDETDSGNSEVGTGPTLDPDDLLLRTGFTRDRCEEVYATDPCGTWVASFTLAPDQQVPGTYDGASVNAFVGERLAPDASGDCGGGGGTLEATLIIESIDDAGVQFRLEGVGLGPDQFDLEGFSAFAPRC